MVEKCEKYHQTNKNKAKASNKQFQALQQPTQTAGTPLISSTTANTQTNKNQNNNHNISIGNYIPYSPGSYVHLSAKTQTPNYNAIQDGQDKTLTLNVDSSIKKLDILRNGGDNSQAELFDTPDINHFKAMVNNLNHTEGSSSNNNKANLESIKGIEGPSSTKNENVFKSLNYQSAEPRLYSNLPSIFVSPRILSPLKEENEEYDQSELELTAEAGNEKVPNKESGETPSPQVFDSEGKFIGFGSAPIQKMKKEEEDPESSSRPVFKSGGDQLGKVPIGGRRKSELMSGARLRHGRRLKKSAVQKKLFKSSLSLKELNLEKGGKENGGEMSEGGRKMLGSSCGGLKSSDNENSNDIDQELCLRKKNFPERGHRKDLVIGVGTGSLGLGDTLKDLVSAKIPLQDESPNIEFSKTDGKTQRTKTGFSLRRGATKPKEPSGGDSKDPKNRKSQNKPQINISAKWSQKKNLRQRRTKRNLSEPQVYFQPTHIIKQRAKAKLQNASQRLTPRQRKKLKSIIGLDSAITMNPGDNKQAEFKRPPQMLNMNTRKIFEGERSLNEVSPHIKYKSYKEEFVHFNSKKKRRDSSRNKKNSRKDHLKIETKNRPQMNSAKSLKASLQYSSRSKKKICYFVTGGDPDTREFDATKSGSFKQLQKSYQRDSANIPHRMRSESLIESTTQRAVGNSNNNNNRRRRSTSRSMKSAKIKARPKLKSKTRLGKQSKGGQNEGYGGNKHIGEDYASKAKNRPSSRLQYSGVSENNFSKIYSKIQLKRAAGTTTGNNPSNVQAQNSIAMKIKGRKRWTRPEWNTLSSPNPIPMDGGETQIGSKQVNQVDTMDAKVYKTQVSTEEKSNMKKLKKRFVKNRLSLESSLSYLNSPVSLNQKQKMVFSSKRNKNYGRFDKKRATREIFKHSKKTVGGKRISPGKEFRHKLDGRVESGREVKRVKGFRNGFRRKSSGNAPGEERGKNFRVFDRRHMSTLDEVLNRGGSRGNSGGSKVELR